MKDCVCLKFFVVESQRHAGQSVYQWLLREAATRHRGRGRIAVVPLHDGGGSGSRRDGRGVWCEKVSAA